MSAKGKIPAKKGGGLKKGGGPAPAAKKALPSTPAESPPEPVAQGGAPAKAPRSRPAPKKMSGGAQKRALPTSVAPRGSDQEVFSLWDIEGDGTIEVSVLGDVLRAVGQSPTEAEIETFINEFSNDSGVIDWPTFQQIMAKGTGRDKDLEQDVYQAYYVFDQKDNGICLSAEVENAFMSIGEKLTDHEVEDLIQYADPNHTGFFKFEDFIKMQLSK
eukprot:TRINITY_DN889_c0_g1_i1.p1 TRINITY_DN889_c0_g1~~TRINITY_DN889_c0_g1_i1.p1  ORF type:complete len:216 (+),score=55.39 TRINITY_DN889_c0_g1_i1:107-754(+)